MRESNSGLVDPIGRDQIDQSVAVHVFEPSVAPANRCRSIGPKARVVRFMSSTSKVSRIGKRSLVFSTTDSRQYDNQARAGPTRPDSGSLVRQGRDGGRRESATDSSRVRLVSYLVMRRTTTELHKGRFGRGRPFHAAKPYRWAEPNI